MASPSLQTPSLTPDTGSEDELDEASSWQHHAGRTDLYLPPFAAFTTVFFNSLEDLIVKKHYGHYDSVHVMLLAWDVPLDSTIKELEDLEQFLTDYLKFSAEYYDIAREDTGNEFNSKLEDVVREYAGANELLIFYYAGHSRLDVTRNTTIWQATRESASPPVHVLTGLNWSTIENRLNQTIAKHSNILYILDSGYTPSMCAPSSRGSKELLAASKDVPKSPAVEDYLFTADLLHELRQQIHATGSISVSTLHSRIIERQAERQIPKPYHLPLSDKASSSSIVLASMTEDSPCIPTRLRESQRVTLCMIQVQVSYGPTPGERAELWADCIIVWKEGVGARPVDYVRRLASGIVGQVHVILVLMPSELSRKLVKMIDSRGFAELKVVKSEAAFTQDMLNEALRKAGLPTEGLH